MGFRRKLRRVARQAKAQNAQVQTPTSQDSSAASQAGGFGKVGAFVRNAKAANQQATEQAQGQPAGGIAQQLSAQVQARRAAPVAQPSGNPAPAAPAAGTLQNQAAMAVEAAKGQADQGAGIQRRGNLATQGGFRR